MDHYEQLLDRLTTFLLKSENSARALIPDQNIKGFISRLVNAALQARFALAANVTVECLYDLPASAIDEMVVTAQLGNPNNKLDCLIEHLFSSAIITWLEDHSTINNLKVFVAANDIGDKLYGSTGRVLSAKVDFVRQFVLLAMSPNPKELALQNAGAKHVPPAKQSTQTREATRAQARQLFESRQALQLQSLAAPSEVPARPRIQVDEEDNQARTKFSLTTGDLATLTQGQLLWTAKEMQRKLREYKNHQLVLPEQLRSDPRYSWPSEAKGIELKKQMLASGTWPITLNSNRNQTHWLSKLLFHTGINWQEGSIKQLLLDSQPTIDAIVSLFRAMEISHWLQPKPELYTYPVFIQQLLKTIIINARSDVKKGRSTVNVLYLRQGGDQPAKHIYLPKRHKHASNNSNRQNNLDDDEDGMVIDMPSD